MGYRVRLSLAGSNGGIKQVTTHREDNLHGLTWWDGPSVG